MARIRQNYLEQSRRPIYCLLFLAPLIIAYEIGVWREDRALLAEQMLRGLLAPRGSAGFLSGLFVLAVLVGRQIASGQDWKARPAVLGVMLLEAVALTLPLFALHAVVPSRSTGPAPAAHATTAVEPAAASPGVERAAPPSTAEPADPTPGGSPEERRRRLVQNIVISLGAGPYEELIFRLFLVELLLWLMTGLLGMERQAAVITAVLISATLFAAYHYLPGTGERFHWGSFLFRTGAGVYFSIVFVVRGYGIAAACHSFYDVLVDLARQ
jgi:hypothetical protein